MPTPVRPGIGTPGRVHRDHGQSSGQIAMDREGTAFPFRFRRGNGFPLVYTTAFGGRGEWSVDSQENYENC